MKKNRQKMRHARAVKTRESHSKRADNKEKRVVRKTNALLKFILTRNFDLFNSIMVNYLNSDSGTGIWSPLLPEVHEVNPSIPPLRECANIIINKCQDDKGELNENGKIAYTWLMMPIDTKRKFYSKIESKLFGEDGAAKAHDSEIWTFADNIKAIIKLTLERFPNSQDPVQANTLSHDVGTLINTIT